jgi:hypothetical protein
MLHGHIGEVRVDAGGTMLRIGLAEAMQPASTGIIANYPKCTMQPPDAYYVVRYNFSDRFLAAVLTAFATGTAVSMWVQYCTPSPEWSYTHPVPEDIYLALPPGGSVVTGQ